MYDNLKSLGITNPEEIDRYSLRQEANNDILKIYFQKDKGEFFAKSVKFKYPRQRKTVVADGVGQGYKEVQEISPNLRYVIDELDQICQRDRSEVDLKRKILDDLRHLESVVTNKISEIEADLEKLTRKYPRVDVFVGRVRRSRHPAFCLISVAPSGNQCCSSNCNATYSSSLSSKFPKSSPVSSEIRFRRYSSVLR